MSSKLDPVNVIEPNHIHCPYCGELIEVLIDCSVENQSYIEDCQVCCRPINFEVQIGLSGQPTVRVFPEDEV